MCLVLVSWCGEEGRNAFCSRVVLTLLNLIGVEWGYACLGRGSGARPSRVQLQGASQHHDRPVPAPPRSALRCYKLEGNARGGRGHLTAVYNTKKKQRRLRSAAAQSQRRPWREDEEYNAVRQHS